MTSALAGNGSSKTEKASRRTQGRLEGWRTELEIARAIRDHGEVVRRRGQELRREARDLCTRARGVRDSLPARWRIKALLNAAAARRRDRQLVQHGNSAVSVVAAERDAAVAALHRAHRSALEIAGTMNGMNERSAGKPDHR